MTKTDIGIYRGLKEKFDPEVHVGFYITTDSGELLLGDQSLGQTISGWEMNDGVLILKLNTGVDIRITFPEATETVKGLLSAADKAQLVALKQNLDSKVDKVTGKSLIADSEIEKLAGLPNSTELTNSIATAKAAGDNAQSDLNSHKQNTSNPHEVTKAQVGLGNVTNDAQVKRTEMGVAGGVATLDDNGKVPSSQLPSYVDDIVDVYATYQKSGTGVLSNIVLYSDAAKTKVVTGEAGKIYQNITEGEPGYQFRWTGTVFSQTGASSLIIGEVAGTAYDGAKGKANADEIAKLKTQVGSLPDEEDITLNAENHLQLKDRDTSKGMGYKILRLPEDGILTQDMVNEANTIYEIRYDFDLNNGTTITLPENCILNFQGGSFKNGRIRFSKNGIIQGNDQLSNVEFVGYYTKVGVDQHLIAPTEYNNQEIIKVVESYLTRKDLFKYGGTNTCFTEECKQIDGYWNINCSTFALLITCGIPFENSKYGGSPENVNNGTGFIGYKDLIEHQLYNSSSDYANVASRRISEYFDVLGYGLSNYSIDDLRMGDILFLNTGVTDTTDFYNEYYGINHVSIFAYRTTDGYYCWEVGGDADPSIRKYTESYFTEHVKRVARVPKFQGAPQLTENIAGLPHINVYNTSGSSKYFLNSIEPLKANTHYTVVAKINARGETIYPRVMTKEDLRVSYNIKNEVKVGDYYYFPFCLYNDTDDVYIQFVNVAEGDNGDIIEAFLYKGIINVDNPSFIREPVLSGRYDHLPEKEVLGKSYFDTYYKKPLFFNGTNWTYADGNSLNTIYRVSLSKIDTEVDPIVKDLINNDFSGTTTLDVVFREKTIGTLYLYSRADNKLVSQLLVIQNTYHNGEWVFPTNPNSFKVNFYQRDAIVGDSASNIEWSEWRNLNINSGSTANKPNVYLNAGLTYFDTDLKRQLIYNGTDWTYPDGVPIKFSRYGTTQYRPVLDGNYKGFYYFDTTLNRPVFWDGTKWVDPAEDSIKWRTIE